MFRWNEKVNQAFMEIQQLLVNEQIMVKLPELGQDFCVSMDASDIGIGMVLK